MHMNKTNKFERNSSLEYYHMTCTEKKNKPKRSISFPLLSLQRSPNNSIGNVWYSGYGEREVGNGARGTGDE